MIERWGGGGICELFQANKFYDTTNTSFLSWFEDYDIILVKHRERAKYTSPIMIMIIPRKMKIWRLE